MQRKTNVEFLTELMEHSRHGTLIQAFVLTAIGRYSGVILEHPDTLREQNKKGLVDSEAWIGCAQEVVDKLAEHFGEDADAKTRSEGTEDAEAEAAGEQGPDAEEPRDPEGP